VARLPEGAGTALLTQKEQLVLKLERMSEAELVDFFSKTDNLIEEREAALEIFKRVPRWKPFELLKAAEALSELPREKLGYLVQEAIYFYRDLLMTKTVTGSDGFVVFNLDCEAFFKEQAQGFSTMQLMDLIRELELSQWDLRGNANAQLLIEALLFKMAMTREREA